jgi:pimeloyl-ACP methyl ester carboxylesterase
MPKTNVNGLDIHYELHGDAAKPVLVMTHGLGGHGKAYEPHLPAFTKEFRVFLWDMRGYGQSDRPEVEPGVYTRYTMASDLSELLKALGIPAAHVHGHSLGGLVAQQFAISYPAQTLSLIIQDSSAEIKEEYVRGWQGMLDTVREKGLHALPNDPRRGWSDGFIQAHPEVIEQLNRESRERNHPGVYVEGIRISGQELFDDPVAPHLSKITCPVLVICGNEDRTTPPGGHVRIHRAIPQSKLVILPGVGHFPNIETPEAYADAILEFLREVEKERQAAKR